MFDFKRILESITDSQFKRESIVNMQRSIFEEIT